MKRMARALKAVLRHLKDTRGVSLYEITAAVAMTGILAAVAVPVIIEKTTDAKVARVTLEADNISQAISAFKRDTGKFPGEMESAVLLLSGPQGMFALLPDNTNVVFHVDGVGINDVTHTCTSGCENMNDYLVRNPNLARPGGGGFPPATGAPLKYSNWKGPYIDEIFIDQFERSYIVNTKGLYKIEPASPGTCGYGWVISGGPDRILSTSFLSNNLASPSDDIGKNNGKTIGQGLGCG